MCLYAFMFMIGMLVTHVDTSIHSSSPEYACHPNCIFTNIIELVPQAWFAMTLHSLTTVKDVKQSNPLFSETYNTRVLLLMLDLIQEKCLSLWCQGRQHTLAILSSFGMYIINILVCPPQAIYCEQSKVHICGSSVNHRNSMQVQ
jgi:hypothetical protein